MADFPLPSALFPELKLPAHQLSDFVVAREQILAATMAARDQFRGRMRSRMNPQTWKVLKRRRHLSDLLSSSHAVAKAQFTVYRPRGGSQIPRPYPTASCSPLLVGVGCVDGSLEDIALGLANATTDAQRTAFAQLHGDVVDARVLSMLEAPTPENPFDTFSFKWTAHAPVVLASGLKSIVRPRDYVYLESCGLRTDPTTGERTFHVLMHSVDIACFRSFEHDKGIVRGAMSLGFLFSDSSVDGRVEVFCKGFVDPKGSAIEQVAISAAMNIMTGFAEQAAQVGASKKLGWLVQQRRERQQRGEIDDLAEFFRGRCVGCGDEPEGSRVLAECDACGRHVCAPCQQQARVVYPSALTSLAALGEKAHRIDVCEHCVVFTHRVDATRVAIDEAVESKRTLRQFSTSLSHSAFLSASGERLKLAPIKKRSQSVGQQVCA
jgi:hypothetical protein